MVKVIKENFLDDVKKGNLKKRHGPASKMKTFIGNRAEKIHQRRMVLRQQMEKAGFTASSSHVSRIVTVICILVKICNVL